MNKLTKTALLLTGATLLAGCTLPISMNLPGQSPVKRIYCSIKSIGIDLHFDNTTGELFSHNEFTSLLDPFKLEKEIPFNEFIPGEAIKEGLTAVGGPQGSIENGNLAIKLFDKTDPSNFVRLLINLETLKAKLDLSKVGSGYNSPSQNDVNTVTAYVGKSLTCEYITPQSIQRSN